MTPAISFRQLTLAALGLACVGAALGEGGGGTDRGGAASGRDACRVTRAPGSGAQRLALGLPLLLDRASAAELRLLPGVGPARAAAIVAAREAAPFHRVEDLLRVRGIGPKRLAALRGLVAVGGDRGGPATRRPCPPRSRPGPTPGVRRAIPPGPPRRP